MNKNISTKLSIMEFLQFCTLGSVIPILSLYMLTLNFSGYQVGLILSTGSVSYFISPILGAFIADRIISAERLFAIFHFLTSIVMLFLFNTTDYHSFLFGYLIYMILIGPTIPLTDTIIFHHIKNRKQQYGLIRVWGSIGWIAIAWTISLFLLKTNGQLRYVFLVSSFASLILSLFSITIPVSGALSLDKPKIFPVDAIKIILKPQVLLLALMTFLMFFSDRFYFYGGSPFLKQIGFSEQYILPILSIGQIPELFAMSLLGLMMSRFNIKIVLLLGVFFNILRYAIFTFFSSKFLIIIGISCHGIAFTFFYAASFIFLDYMTTKENRAGVHQLFRIIYLAFGTLLGNLSAGFIKDFFHDKITLQTNYFYFWIIPGIINIIIFVIIGKHFYQHNENKI